jgi:hypothetical protein
MLQDHRNPPEKRTTAISDKVRVKVRVKVRTTGG